MPADIQPNSIEIAVVDSAERADELINTLLASGLARERISVLCTDEASRTHFQHYVDEAPPGQAAEEAVDQAGVAGLTLGGATILTGLLASTGTALFAIGAFTGLAITGTFAALMASRGTEPELTELYDEALVAGKILIAIEPQDADDRRRAHGVFQAEGIDTKFVAPE